MSSTSLTLCFVGAGHANTLAIRELSMTHIDDNVELKVILLSDYRRAAYSGMIPGAVSKLYEGNEASIDIIPLCEQLKVSFIHSRVLSINSAERRIDFVHLREPTMEEVKDSCSTSPIEGEEGSLCYDLLAIGVGSITRGLDVLQEAPACTRNKVISTRPISELLVKLDLFEDTFPPDSFNQPLEIVTVGAGAAGIEMAFASHVRFKARYGNCHVTLIAREKTSELLQDRGRMTRWNVVAELKKRNITVLYEKQAFAIDESDIHLCGARAKHDENVEQSTVPYDLCVWATGAAPPVLLQNVDFTLSKRGFLSVRKTLQCVNSDIVFATGDCCDVADSPQITKAGVYAVREAPFLAHNIAQMARSLCSASYKPVLKEYNAQSDFLSLLMTGDGSAIMSKWWVSSAGGWVWSLKNKIDKDFMRLFGGGEREGTNMETLQKLGESTTFKQVEEKSKAKSTKKRRKKK